MKSTSSLSRIYDVLRKEDFPVFLQPATEDHLFEKLFVDLGQKINHKDVALQIHFVNDITNALGLDDDPDDVIILQFFILLPFNVQKTHLLNLNSVISIVNRILPVGYFGISEQDEAPYFQYNLACSDRNIKDTLIEEIVSMIGYFFNEYAEKIYQASSGKFTKENLINEFGKTGIELPKLTTS